MKRNGSPAAAERPVDWDVWSRHGSVMLFVATHPGASVDDIARGMHLTPRTIRDIIGDLRTAGILTVRPNGRRHHYLVNLDGPFRHPTIRGVTLRPLLGVISRVCAGTQASP
jgi:hypothetical protein